MNTTKTHTRQCSRSTSELSSSSQFTFNVEEWVNESSPSAATEGDRSLAAGDSHRSLMSFPPRSVMDVGHGESSLDRSERTLSSLNSDVPLQLCNFGASSTLRVPETSLLPHSDSQNTARAEEPCNPNKQPRNSREDPVKKVPTLWPISVAVQGNDFLASKSQARLARESRSHHFGLGIDELQVHTPMPPKLAQHAAPQARGRQTVPCVVAHDIAQTGASQATQLRHKSLVEFGYPRGNLVEGWQVYSRHSLLMWGAHKSDVCPVNGNPRDGCDSILCMRNEDEELRTIDDLDTVQVTCSNDNGGGALFANYRLAQLSNALHTYPVRVFRKSKDTSGVEGLRYDGLYHVASIRDEKGQRLTEPASKSSRCSFLLKRNGAGHLGDENQYSLEELWELVKPGNASSVEPLELKGDRYPCRFR